MSQLKNETTNGLINANPVFWVPVSWVKVLGVITPLPNC